VSGFEVRSQHHCQCACWDRVCWMAITQEDLLCDACRAGCSLIGAASDDQGWALHLHITKLDFSLARPARLT
jgi:hypothetical protein